MWSFALSAVVTREGRVGQIELIDSPRTAGTASQTAAQVADLTAVLNAARESRFSPRRRAADTPSPSSWCG